MLLWVIGIEEPGGCPYHVDAKSTIEIFLSLVVGSNPYTNLDTHLLSKYYTLLNLMI